MSARNEERGSEQQQIMDLERKLEKLTRPGTTPPSPWVMRVGPPHYPAGQGGWVYDPEGQDTGPVVGPVILVS